jgi:hypothetical protein
MDRDRVADLGRWLETVRSRRTLTRFLSGGALLAPLVALARGDTAAKGKGKKRRKKKPVCTCSASGCTSQKVTKPSSLINQNPRCNYAGACTTNPCAAAAPLSPLSPLSPPSPPGPPPSPPGPPLCTPEPPDRWPDLPHHLCDGVCVFLRNDDNHCGGCAISCNGGDCVDGTCNGTCPPERPDDCGICVNTDTDPANCGDCFNVCNADETCVNGKCKKNPPGR